MSYDVVTLGETMLRLTPPDFQRLEQGQSFAIHVGGSESNVAVGLSRLGASVTWVSRLTDNALGQHIVQRIRAHDVDTSHICWTDDDRIGLYFLEEATAPRSSQVIYDRAGSAMSRMQPDDLPDIFQPDTARLLHLSGITLALSEKAAATAQTAADYAKAAGWLLSFDVNYRALLWSPEDAAAACEPLAQAADILFLPLRDAITLYDMPSTPQDAIAALAERYPQAVIVLTCGADGAFGASNGEIIHQPIFPAEPIGRVGGGDAFVAGFLYDYLQFASLTSALVWATAAAAVKYSIPGDMPIFRLHDLQEVMNRSSSAKSSSLRR